MSRFNTGICCIPNGVPVSTFTLLQTPAVAQTEYQSITNLQNTTQAFYVSTVTAYNKAINPTYAYQYRSQTDRINAKLGRLALGGCN